jgi:hypothetical protein
MVGFVMNNKLERTGNEAVATQQGYYPGIFLEGLRNTTKIPPALVEIRAEKLPNSSIDHYRYTNLLGIMISKDR